MGACQLPAHPLFTYHITYVTSKLFLRVIIEEPVIEEQVIEEPVVDEPAADTTAPVISLVGISLVEIEQGVTYIDEGATATDDVDGDITANIVVANLLDTATAGTYTITYNVADAAGNVGTPVTRTVNVIESVPTETASTEPAPAEEPAS